MRVFFWHTAAQHVLPVFALFPALHPALFLNPSVHCGRPCFIASASCVLHGTEPVSAICGKRQGRQGREAKQRPAKAKSKEAARGAKARRRVVWPPHMRPTCRFARSATARPRPPTPSATFFIFICRQGRQIAG